MASVTSRQGLIDYCLRKLGQPVIEINIDEDQLEERIDDAVEFANLAAGVVVGKIGSATATLNEIIEHESSLNKSTSDNHIKTIQEISKISKEYRKKNRKVVFTNGCFDLLHPGHISLLNQARDSTDKLVVGLNSDVSVRLLKGDKRPVQSELTRATILASLSAVDMVIIFSEETPIKLIEKLRPDVLIKGADYTVSDVVGADEVISYGGRVLLAEIIRGHSTTGTIAKLGKEST